MIYIINAVIDQIFIIKLDKLIQHIYRLSINGSAIF